MLIFILFFLVLLSQITYAQYACLPLGPTLPPPRKPSTSRSLRDALALVEKTIELSLRGGSQYASLDCNTISFSTEVYSLFEKEPLWTYHFSAPEFRNSEGVNEVDSNTVYRIGSLSKLFTVYTSIVAVGNDYFFREPVTKYVPELAKYAARYRANITSNQIDFWDFESMTLEALAGQLSGLPGNFAFGPLWDRHIQTTFGLPITPPAAGAFCQQGENLQLPCNRSAFFENILSQDPVTLTFHTPIYSNVNYVIFAYAIASLLETSFPELMERHFIRGLSLNSTYLSSPTNASTSIIPYNRTWSLYDWDLQDEAPSGGYYTTINDLRKIGLAMMNSTQLDRHITRRWFKPVAFTASSTMAAGLPWEIVLAPNTSSRLWMYTKYGNLGAYSSYIILIPDLGMGVSVLTAGVASLPAAQGMSNIISSIMVPAMEQVAKEEANTTYSGTYRSANGSITILTDNGPGLLVQNDTFTWNGSNMGSAVAILDRVNNSPFEIRLWPTTQMAELDNGGYATAWRAVIQALPVVENPLPFPGDCNSWLHVDEITYGGVGLDDFVFLLESKEGNANAVMPKFLRTTYKR